MSHYPPPPPAPVRAQGAPPGGIPPVPANFNPQGQPGGPAPRTGLSSQNPQIPNSGRSVFVNSSRIVDVTQPVKLDEAECRKKFTTYAVYTVKKAPPPNPRADLTWARAEVVEERLDYGATLKQIKNLNEASRKSVGKKMAELGFNQGAQVSRILDELINKEKDQNFVWTLAQIGKQERLLKSKSSSKRDSPKRETTVMTVYVMREPLPHVNCKQLKELKEKQLAEILQPNRPPMNQQNQQNQQAQNNQQRPSFHPPPPPPQPNRPPVNQQNQQPQNNQQPRPFPPPPQQPPPPPANHQGGGPGGGGGPGFFPVPPHQKPQNQGPGPTRAKGPLRPNTKSPGPGARGAGKKYHVEPMSESDTSTSSYESDSMSDVEATSSISSVSESFGKHKKERRRSHSRSIHRSKSNHRRPARRHQKEHQYFAEDRRRSPSPRSYRHDMPALQPSRPTHVPQMPRAHHAIDPVIAAYQAGKEDAAEQFGLDERERHVPPPRAIPRPVVIEQPQAVISYVPGRREGFAEPRYPGRPSVQRLTETRYSPPLTLPQFSEERYFDPRRAMRQERRNFRRDPLDYLSESEFSSEPGFSPIRRDFRGGSDYHDREREAQDYIDHPAYNRRATEPSNYPRGPHPFAPLPLGRRYSPSLSSGSPGW